MERWAPQILSRIQLPKQRGQIHDTCMGPTDLAQETGEEEWEVREDFQDLPSAFLQETKSIHLTQAAGL